MNAVCLLVVDYFSLLLKKRVCTSFTTGKLVCACPNKTAHTSVSPGITLNIQYPKHSSPEHTHTHKGAHARQTQKHNHNHTRSVVVALRDDNVVERIWTEFGLINVCRQLS